MQIKSRSKNVFLNDFSHLGININLKQFLGLMAQGVVHKWRNTLIFSLFTRRGFFSRNNTCLSIVPWWRWHNSATPRSRPPSWRRPGSPLSPTTPAPRSWRKSSNDWPALSMTEKLSQSVCEYVFIGQPLLLMSLNNDIKFYDLKIKVLTKLHNKMPGVVPVFWFCFNLISGT